nr:HYR domain-containing protein [Bacteroidales bacterium]
MGSKNSISAISKTPVFVLIPSVAKELPFHKKMIIPFLSEINRIRKWGIVLVGLLSISLSSFAQVDGDYQTRATGNWDADATWQVRSGGLWVNCLPGDYPGAALGTGTVTILNSHAVTLNLSPANPIGALTFAPGNIALSSVAFSSNWILNVTGAVTFTIPGANNNGDQTLDIGTGNLNCASISMVTTTNNNRIQTLLLGTGTINVTGGITMATALQNVITVSGTGIINLGGNFTPGTGTFTAGTGLVNYNGADQNLAGLTYYNLTISGSGNKTLQGNVTVGGNLNVNAGSLDFGNTVIRTLTLTGDLTGAGIIDMSGGSLAHVLNLGGVNNTIGTLTTAAGASIINYNRAGDQSVFTNANYRNLTISGSGNKTMQGDVTVGGIATFSTAGCSLVINGNTLFLANRTAGTNGTITGSPTSNIVITGNATPAMTLPNITGGLNNFTINKTGATNVVNLGGALDIGNTLTLTAGALSIGANTLTLPDGANLFYGAGSLTGGVTSNFTVGTGADISLNAIAGGLNNFNTSRNITLGSGLSLNGTLTITAGTFTVGANTLTLNGPSVAGTPSNLITTAASSLIFGGTTAGVLIPSSVVALNGLSITNTNIVSLQSSPTISGVFNPGGGGLSIEANTLTLNGQINCGTLAGGAASNIIIGNAGAANLSAVTLNNLTIGRAVTLCGSVTVGGTLTLNAGALSIAANTLALSDGATLSYGLGSLTGGVTSNLTIGTGADITLNAIANGINNFNVSRNIVLGANLVINGTLTLTAGNFTVGPRVLTLNGPAIAGTPVNLIAGAASSLSFGGSSAGVFIPSNVANLLNLTINNANGVTMNSDISLAAGGVLTLSNGILQAGTFVIKINNTSPAGAIVWTPGSFINVTTGGVERTLLPNLVGTANNYLFPVGDGGAFKGINLREVRTGVTGPVLRASVSATGALTGDGVTIGTVNPRYWSLINLNSGNLTSAKVELYESGLDLSKTIGMSLAVGGNYTAIGGSSNAPSIISPTVLNPGPYFCIGASILDTYYSFQTGDWNTPTTWTSDPSGTLQIGSTVPGDNDKVIILSGRTVSLPADIATLTLDITIDAGGFLDQNIYRFTNGIYSLRGQGTIKLASVNFPVSVINTFVNSGGGTAEYNNTANFTLPAAQTTYNNLTINTSGFIATQLSNITLNGNLNVKSGTLQINNNVLVAKLNLTINGDVTVDNGAFITVGNGPTNPVIGGAGGVAPFLNYYLNFHTVIIKGDFTNNGTVRFTNLPYPIYNAFPPIVAGPTSGAASVYFQGNTNNTITCNGITDFYNLILDKGIDQTFKLTINSTSYTNFRLFGANTVATDGAVSANPNIRKAIWIRTGTLVLKGSVIIPSLSEGIAGTADYYIPSNGALVFDGVDVVVLSSSDDYREINTAYSVAAPGDAAVGVTRGGVSALYIFGKLQIDNGYLSARESGGLITSNVSSGQFIINNGTVDAKQFLSLTGSASYTQNGGLFILRGRFQRTPVAYTTVADLSNVSVATLNTSRALNSINPGFGSFNLEQATNIFTMSGGTIRIYDVCGIGAGEQEAFDVKSSSSNINVTGGTIEIVPTTGIVLADAANYSVYSSASLNDVIINRTSSASIVRLNAPLVVLNDFSLNSGDFDANNFNISIARNVIIENGTSYTSGTNTTILNGTGDQTYTVNLAAPLSLNKFTIDKPAGVIVNLAGSQNTINVNDNFRLVSGTLNDNGKTINIARDVYNSGLHSGTGRIVLNGTLTQIIDGNGIFENVELNNTNAAAAPVSLAAKMTINGTLTFSQDKLFNIGTNNLALNASAAFANISSARYIQTGGNAGDGGVTKVYNSTGAFTFPVGAPTITPAGLVKYTPATIGFSSAPAVYGSVTVYPVGYEHPATIINGQSLTYFWRIKSTGFSGIAPNSVTHSFTYAQGDVAGNEANYIPALYTNNDFTWRNGTNANPPIDIANNLVTDWTIPTNSTDFLDADYTAGDAAFGAPQIYYSRQTGLWGNLATWSLTGHTVDNPPAVPPGLNDIVIIGGQDSVYLATDNTVPNTDVRNCASLQIEIGSALDIGYNFNSNFGIVQNHPNGNGNFRLTTSWTTGSTFTFPLGDFTDFNINLGTTELYSTNAGPGTTYWLPNGVFSYGNLIISPLGGSNIIFANNDITIYGNLVTRGQNADSWFCPTWNIPYPTAPTVVVAKTITINGDLDIQGGSLYWYGNGAIAQNIVVNGNVIVATFSGINSGGGAANQRLSIGGNLINNTNGIVNPPAGNRAFCNFTNIPVTFFGSNSASISNTAGTPLTIFGQVVINKGTSQAVMLTCNIGGTLTTLTNNWLTLQNGTFRYMRTDPATDFTISTTTAFTIPSTAGLSIDYANANNRNILIGNAGNNSGDLLLSGKLTLISGNVFIGPVTAPANNNDIEYSGSGASALEIQGGTLVVNGQIRRNTSTTNGILNYTQSGGNLTINGNAAVAGYAKLEVLNAGSAFNMSGGTLTIVRGGGTTFGDLYLRPAGTSVTGGTIVFTNVIPNTIQNYSLDANIPLHNLTITGTAGAGLNANLGLIVNPLVINGTLTLSNAQSILNSNNLNVSVKGDLSNSGTYNFGTNTTTFNGDVQVISGSSVTNFYNLKVSSSNTLTVNNSFSVNRDMEIESGTLVLGNNKVTLSGDLVNNGSYTDDNTTGGISLSGTTLQQISGSGAYGKLEIYNNSGAKLNNDIFLKNDLALTQGIFNINSNRLTLSENSIIIGVPDVTRMVMCDGVTSSLGLRKFFTAAPQSFTFPVGVAGKYTPATFTITANGSIGSINVNPIKSNHPSVLDPSSVLNYYWQIESSGIDGFDGNLLLQYLPGDVQGLESAYVAARLELPGNYWYEAPTGPATDNVDETTHRITFNYSGSSNLNGDYTAGIDAAIPGEVSTYETNSDGNWSDQSIWTPVGASPPCPAGGPNGANVVIDHVVTTIFNNIYALNTTINNELRITSPTFGHNLGNVDGDGTIYLENGNLPAGNYTSFIDCSGDGTIEYGGTGTYTIIATQFSSLPNMFISGTGTRILPNKDLTICKRLIIDAATLDNSVNNYSLTILGTMERYNSGVFTCGTGASPASTVTFAGSVVQTLGGLTGDFTGSNKFNNLEINNPAGLNIDGLIEVNNELLLTSGIINTTSANKLTLLSTSSAAVFPTGGSANSFVSGPLIKYINNGGSFIYPVGKGTTKGHSFTLTSSAGSTIPWTAEYFTPNPTATSLTLPLKVSNTKEYWSVSTIAGATAKVKIGWDPLSDLTPLMTENGITDMRVADYNAPFWTELASTTSGNNNNGDVATTNNVNISATPKDFTTASISSTIARASLTPAGPICGMAGIPVSFTSFNPINLDYTLDYSVNGAAQPTINVTTLPYFLPTPVPGAYRLTGFTYNNGANIGVVDGTPVNAYALPTPANAGSDQSLCGVSGLVLGGNDPVPYPGLWTIVSGAGGTFINNAQYNTVFTGLLGVTYTLRWTISNASCSSSDDVIISFPIVASMPSNFTSGPTQVCQGSGGYVYTVPNVLGNTYNWTFTGSGHTINGTGNSVTIDFNSSATSGTLNVTATNSCGTSVPRTLVITVNTLPAPSIVGNLDVCANATGITYSTTNNPGNTYSWVVSGGVINGSTTGSSILVDWGGVGTGTVRVTETNPVTGCTFTTPFTNVTINNDLTPPVIAGCPSDISVNNDPALCSAVVSWIEPTATDNCTPAGSIIWTKSHLPGATFPVGTTVVNYTATDGSSNTSLVCSFTVTVTDNTSPVITLPAPPVLNADASCQATVPAIAATATDNCSIPANITISQNPLAGTIIGAGVTVVTVNATDQTGNSALSNINVTVLDVTPPTLTPVGNRDENLNGSCSFVIPDYRSLSTAADNCGAPVVTQSPIVGTAISGAGTVQLITLTATDGGGNTAVTNFAITLKDVTPPVANCKNITVILDATGNASIVAADVNNGSIDNCGINTLSVDRTSFTCADIGVVPVTLTVTDNSFNTSFCISNVTVTSSLNINNVTLQTCNAIPGIAALFEANVVGGDGNYTYFWDGLNDAVDPFMEITLVPLSITTSNTTTLETPFLNWFLPDGLHSVQLTVTDGNGCTDTFIINFTKTGLTTDNISVNYSNACEGEIKTYSVGYDVDANYAWEVENGTILSAITDTNEVDIEWDLGVTLGVVRTNITQPSLFGDCESSVIDSVTVYPTPAPAFLASDIEVCQGSVNTYTLSNTYSIYNWTITGGSIIFGGAGNNFATVLWTTAGTGNVEVEVISAAGCSNTTDVDVAVYQVTGNIDSQINESCTGNADGSVTVSGSGGLGAHHVSINGGITYFNSPHTFSGLSAGSYTVIVRDDLNCTDNLSVNIIVDDAVPPIAICKDITVQLDASGNASIVVTDINNGSFDNCGIASITLSNSLFDCTDIGPNNVTLTVTDVNSNVSNCVGIVTVVDNLPPVMTCPGPLNVQCISDVPVAYANYAAFTGAGGSASDNCSIDVLSFILLSEVDDGNTCPKLITRTYQIADVSGNTVTCTQTITVDDNINPTASNPAPVSVSCTSGIPVPNIAVVTDEADNCGVPVVAFVSDVSNGLTCPEIITRTYSVTDAC